MIYMHSGEQNRQNGPDLRVVLGEQNFFSDSLMLLRSWVTISVYIFGHALLGLMNVNRHYICVAVPH